MTIQTKFDIGQKIDDGNWHYRIDHISVTDKGIRYGGECWQGDIPYSFIKDLRTPTSRFGLDEKEVEDIYVRSKSDLQSVS